MSNETCKDCDWWKRYSLRDGNCGRFPADATTDQNRRKCGEFVPNAACIHPPENEHNLKETK